MIMYFEEYQRFCSINNFPALGKNKFNNELQKRDFTINEAKRRREGIIFIGIKIKSIITN
jgi:hypothetical protein